MSDRLYCLGDILVDVVDWLEKQVETEKSVPLTEPFQQQLTDCAPIAFDAYQRVSKRGRVALHGPTGTYPLALGLALISEVVGKSWNLVARPKDWFDADWERLTEVVDTLRQYELIYSAQTGAQSVTLDVD